MYLFHVTKIKNLPENLFWIYLVLWQQSDENTGKTHQQCFKKTFPVRQEVFQFVQNASNSVLCPYLTVTSDQTLYCYVCSTESMYLYN